jgi:hypothetical protein
MMESEANLARDTAIGNGARRVVFSVRRYFR